MLHVSKQTVGIRILCVFNLFEFFLFWKDTFRRVNDIFQCSSPEAATGMAVVNFIQFSVALYCNSVIYQKKIIRAL